MPTSIHVTSEPGHFWMYTMRQALKSVSDQHVVVIFDGRRVDQVYIDMCLHENKRGVADPNDRPAVDGNAKQRYA